MAIAPPASSQAGTQPEPHKEPKNQPEVEQTETGMELEAALPVAEPPVASDATPRVKRKKQETTPDKTDLVIAGVDESSESSASHLAGSSAKAIQTVDAKFQRLLETVHGNRPAADLEIIR